MTKDTVFTIRGRGWNGSRPVAGFDMDCTLIKTKSGRRFPRDASDWRWMHPEIPERLANISAEGHSLAIITNQLGKSAEWVSQIASELSAEIRAPVYFIAALARDRWRKPCPDSWTEYLGRAPGEDSYYVGDAAGRPPDHSDTDRKYALNVGVRFMTPEEWFTGIAQELPPLVRFSLPKSDQRPHHVALRGWWSSSACRGAESPHTRPS